MPLLDHFRPPLSVARPWEGVHSNWATKIADHLNLGLLPDDYVAIPQITVGGQMEIDVATFQDAGGETANGSGGAATAVWAPPQPLLTAVLDLAQQDAYEVQVFQEMGGPKLRAAIELVSPANKNRPSHRLAFAVKCAAYLQRGVSVMVVDVVTERTANMHDELMAVLRLDDSFAWQSPSGLYEIAYREVCSSGQTQVLAWPEPLRIGGALPTAPLWLDVDLCLPLRLEETYLAACHALRIAV